MVFSHSKKHWTNADTNLRIINIQISFSHGVSGIGVQGEEESFRKPSILSGPQHLGAGQRMNRPWWTQDRALQKVEGKREEGNVKVAGCFQNKGVVDDSVVDGISKAHLSLFCLAIGKNVFKEVEVAGVVLNGLRITFTPPFSLLPQLVQLLPPPLSWQYSYHLLDGHS